MVKKQIDKENAVIVIDNSDITKPCSPKMEAIFALAFLGIANDPDTGVPDAAPGNDIISTPIELFTSMAFLIFTSVMLASFIVSAYRNKTMNLMFSYPIKRQKILASQMLAVWIFNFLALVLT